MCDKKMTESLSAIKQYIFKNEQNEYRHKANILIGTNKKDHGLGTRWVNVFIEGNLGQVIIEEIHTLCSCCSNTFTTQNSYFTFVSNTLCINYKDPIFGEININIT